MPATNRTIAVVEDDKSMLKGIANLLSVWGFTTELYSSAEEYLTERFAQRSCMFAARYSFGRDVWHRTRAAIGGL